MFHDCNSFYFIYKSTLKYQSPLQLSLVLNFTNWCYQFSNSRETFFCKIIKIVNWWVQPSVQNIEWSRVKRLTNRGFGHQRLGTWWPECNQIFIKQTANVNNDISIHDDVNNINWSKINKEYSGLPLWQKQFIRIYLFGDCFSHVSSPLYTMLYYDLLCWNISGTNIAKYQCPYLCVIICVWVEVQLLCQPFMYLPYSIQNLELSHAQFCNHQSSWVIVVFIIHPWNPGLY